MANYKVIQDIEAEDHILGPLSFRQFIYALISVFLLYINFVLLTKHLAFLIILFLPPALFSGFLAFPFRKDQSTEVWALAKLRFIVKPHKRIWDQTGIKELVTITVPKKIDVVRTDGLNQTQVRSRLHALADTIDSRGWAIKNVNVNLGRQSQGPFISPSDRLVDISSMPQQVPQDDVQASDDILDERSNPIAYQVDQMINAASTAHRQQIIDRLNQTNTVSPSYDTLPPVSYGPPGNITASTDASHQGALPGYQNFVPVAASSPVAVPTPEEIAFMQQLGAHNDQIQTTNHLRTIQPISDLAAPLVTPSNGPIHNNIVANESMPLPQSPAAVTAIPNPAILNLSKNDSWNVATIARELHKQDEVIVPLR